MGVITRPWMLLVAVVGCAPLATPPAQGTALEAHPLCNAADTEEEKLVVDWSALDRTRLEAAVRRGVVPMRVEGCRARIVGACKVRRPYAFAATSRQREVLRLRDRDEVAARLPILSVRLGGSLARANAVDVSMTVVGRYESDDAPIAPSDLDGDCESATHVAASLSVGTFAIATASGVTTEIGADVVQTVHARERQYLDAAGIESACSSARAADPTPPDGCSVPLRLELRALRASATNGAKAAKARTSPDAPDPPAYPVRFVDDASAGADAQTDAEAAMRRAMTAVRKELDWCHRVARASSPDMSGALTLSLKLARNGNVRSVGARPEGKLDDGLAACAVERVGHVHFPAGDDDRPRAVVVPLLFRPLAR